MRLIVLAGVCVAAGVLLAVPLTSQARDTTGGQFASGELLVRFEPSAEKADRAAALDEVDAETRERLFVSGLRLVEIEGISVPRAAAELERQAEVRYAEPNFIERLDAAPNDTYFGSQWALHNTGQGVSSPPVFGTPDADIDAVQAWDVHTGSGSVKLGITDTGVFYNHPDLAANIYANPGESGGGKEANGVDDDGNGYVDDYRGFDFFSDDNDPAPGTPATAERSHGTRVASAAGAQGDNSLGVTGSAQDVALMPLRVGDTSSFVSAQIEAYGYAKALGAKVINLSAGGTSFSQARLDAIRAAPNVLFVFAAGNGGADNIGDDNDASPIYPCVHSEPNVVCVAATDQDDDLASFSNFGSGSVDLAAPGVNILMATIGTDPANSYVFSNGTSFAAPIVAGAAAVYRSLNPQATAAATRNALREGVDTLTSLSNRVETDGRLNLAATLGIVPPPEPPPPEPEPEPPPPGAEQEPGPEPLPPEDGSPPPPEDGSPPPDGTTPPPDGVLPSNEFSFGKVRRNKRKGTAKLTVKVPGPGELDLAKAKKVKADDEPAEAAGKEKLRVKPKGKAKKKLNRKGKAKVRAIVTFTPDGGSPNTETKKIKLVKR